MAMAYVLSSSSTDTYQRNSTGYRFASEQFANKGTVGAKLMST